MEKKSREEITLEISNYWLANDYFTERNKNCGTLVAFDWIGDYLSEINTNIDLGDVERINFYYDTFIEFLKNNKFTYVLGLRNIKYDDNPSTDWLNPLKEKLLELKYINNKISGFMSDPDIIIIDINHENFMKIKHSRQNALLNGQHHAANEDYVKASITYEGKEYKSRLKLKGTNADHWKHQYKWSLKVKLLNGEHIDGLITFSIMHPVTRSYIKEI